MALDKQFLRYKLESIKNKRIFKDQDTETKKRIRKENAKLSAEEADAIHSYLTGEDNIDKLDNKSFLENRAPGNLFLNPKQVTMGKRKEWVGNLNIKQVQRDPKIKKSALSQMLKRFRTVSKFNIDFAKQLIIFKRIFDKLNIMFSSSTIKTDGIIDAGGFKSKGSIGITEDFVVSDTSPSGITVRKRIVVKNGLIVGQEVINN
tara:strand:+ start:188 stop:799 length:612 start_codon:yes stop_codon:yes gene_type:complete